MRFRLLAGLWCLALTGVARWALLRPVQSTPVKLVFVGSVVGVVVGLVLLSGRRAARWAALGVMLISITPVLIAHVRPAGGVPPARYADTLLGYEGVPYVWGGESPEGIDCSGLVRRALRDALVEHGMQTHSLALLGESTALWWSDQTARALGEGGNGDTMLLFEAADLRSVDHRRLQEGDLAVTRDGLHVLAYVGGRRWIQADPSVMRVHTLHVDASNPWFTVPVRLTRWRVLQ